MFNKRRKVYVQNAKKIQASLVFRWWRPKGMWLVPTPVLQQDSWWLSCLPQGFGRLHISQQCPVLGYTNDRAKERRSCWCCRFKKKYYLYYLTQYNTKARAASWILSRRFWRGNSSYQINVALVFHALSTLLISADDSIGSVWSIYSLGVSGQYWQTSEGWNYSYIILQGRVQMPIHRLNDMLW